MRVYELGVKLISSWLPEGFKLQGEVEVEGTPYHATVWEYNEETVAAGVVILSELVQLGDEDSLKAHVIAEVQKLRKIRAEAGLPVWGDIASVHSSKATNEEETHG